MKRTLIGCLVLLAFSLFHSAAAAEDAAGCKDHPLFNRMPGYHIIACDHADFDMRRFPVGLPFTERKPKQVEVEGAFTYLSYELDEGGKKASGLQIMRNFQSAAKAAGGTVEGDYPDWCNASVDYDSRLGNTCTNWGTTVKFQKGSKEVWAYVQMQEDDITYGMQIVERKAMKQEIVVNALVDKINKEGFITLYINFDTGKSTIKSDSTKTLGDVATALKSVPDLKLEVGGHTDNVGTPESNQKLSHDRAEAVMGALVSRGITANRLTAKGYGQTAPIADNRTEDGRAKNRRVELVKK